MNILKDVPLHSHSSFKLGGKADFFVSIENRDELREAIRFARSIDVPFLVVGGFSNILFADAGFRGLIIKNHIEGYEFFEKNGAVYVGVGAGETWDAFVENMVERGLHGVENMSGIPGTVGATPIQNVGAYGREVKDVISWVEALNTETLETELFSNRQCHFGYRDSFFKTPEGKKFVVLEVGFKLEKSGTPQIGYRDLTEYFNRTEQKPSLRSVRDAVLQVRGKKFPDLNLYGCGGSFFKNPIVDLDTLSLLRGKHPDVPFYELGEGAYKVPLAWLLEHVVPWKGIRRESVGVHGAQPIVLVHYGKGTSRELKKLSDDIIQSIRNETNILISPEVQIVGEF